MPEVRVQTLVACGAAGGISATFTRPGGRDVLRAGAAAARLQPDVVFGASRSRASRQPWSGAPSATPRSCTSRDRWGHAAGVPAVRGARAGRGGRRDRVHAGPLPRRGRLRPALEGDPRPRVAPASGRRGAPRSAAARAAADVRRRLPVLEHGVPGSTALAFLAVLVVGKVLATSLTLGVGGSGGVFAPSLFIGAMVGAAFGEVARRSTRPARAGRGVRGRGDGGRLRRVDACADHGGHHALRAHRGLRPRCCRGRGRGHRHGGVECSRATPGTRSSSVAAAST